MINPMTINKRILKLRNAQMETFVCPAGIPVRQYVLFSILQSFLHRCMVFNTYFSLKVLWLCSVIFLIDLFVRCLILRRVQGCGILRRSTKPASLWSHWSGQPDQRPYGHITAVNQTSVPMVTLGRSTNPASLWSHWGSQPNQCPYGHIGAVNQTSVPMVTSRRSTKPASLWSHHGGQPNQRPYGARTRVLIKYILHAQNKITTEQLPIVFLFLLFSCCYFAIAR